MRYFRLIHQADVFGAGNPLDDVAAEWIGKFRQDEKEPVANFFTFLFKCAGCDHKVEAQVLEDPDSFSSQIDDVQQSYQAVCPGNQFLTICTDVY